MMTFLQTMIRFKSGKGQRQFKEEGISIRLVCLLTAFVLPGIISTGLAQGDTWTTKTDMPTPRQSQRSCAVNGKIYVFGGENTGTRLRGFNTLNRRGI